jgi:hypothetical protein
MDPEGLRVTVTVPTVDQSISRHARNLSSPEIRGRRTNPQRDPSGRRNRKLAAFVKLAVWRLRLLA